MSDNCGIVTGDILGDILGDINALPMSPIGDIPGGYISPLKGGGIYPGNVAKRIGRHFQFARQVFPPLKSEGRNSFG